VNGRGPVAPPKIVVVPISDALGPPDPRIEEKVGPKEILRGLWQGQPGNLRFEVCELVSEAEPTVQAVRAAWSKRRGRRSVPLIVFWQGPNYVLMTEPTGEPATVAIVQMDPAAARAVISRALTSPSRDAVLSVVALLERAQGSGGVAGFRNRNLLSTHYVLDGFRRDHQQQWIELDNASAKIRGERGGKLLRALGYLPTDQPSAFEVLQDGKTRVHALVLPENTPLDRSAAGPGDAPSTHALIDARNRGADRAVVVSGGLLRLYFTKTRQGLTDLATAGTYIELDLDILGSEWSALLPLLFSADSNRIDGLIDQIAEASERYAVGLRDRFQERIYEEVVGDLVLALFEARGRKPADAEILFNATLRLLYRLLFVLYAEDRNLLPLGNPEYRRVSLTETLLRMEAMQGEGKPFDPKATTIWDDLFRVFDAIRQGNIEWNVPAYNGGLFEPDLPNHKDAAFLHSVKIPNAALAPLLVKLAFDSEDGSSGKIDFGDLGIRHLGTLYEGLLSFSVHIAEQDLVLDSDDMYVPAKKKDEPDVLEGEPYLTSPKGGRKTSGSYYTPSFVVRRLINNSLVPTLEEHLIQVAKLPVEQQWDAMLDFRAVDPAMGSGHFLVDALDTIADRLTRFLKDNPRISAKPIEKARAQVTAIGKQYGIDGLGEGIGDFVLLRRNVMRSCIYGVDLNPMAVELAQLGLWLHAFVPGLPLSYLGHNLRHGNALVGIVGQEIEGKLQGKLFDSAVKTALDDALEHSKRLATISDLSIEEVKKSEAAQEKMEDATAGLEATFDAYSCRVFAVDPDAETKAIREQGKAMLEEAYGLEQVLTGALKGPAKKQIIAAQKVARGLGAFHWQLAFPEVFLRKNPGFDVILGNPPWEEVTTEQLGFFAPYLPGIKDINSQSERAKLIKAFTKRRPDVAEAYDLEVQRNEDLRKVLASNYQLTQSGDTDVYRSFAERALKVVRNDGAIGMVYPHSLVTTDGTAPYRVAAFAAHEVIVDFAVNAGRWLFADVHPQYNVIALARRKGDELVSTSGPVANLTEWDKMDRNRVTWTIDELRSISKGLELPLLPNAAFAALFKKMISNGQSFRAPIDGATFRPWTEFHATNDRKSGLLKEDGRGWPVYKGDNFDLWTPEQGSPPFTIDSKIGLANLQEKRLNSDVWKSFPQAVLDDPSTLPPNNCHILFRDITNRLNNRTIIACLVPPKRFATNKAPVLLCHGGGYPEIALRLGIMCSLAFDWTARRRVERSLNFFILNALPVPRLGLSDARAKRVMTIAATLSACDDRFADFARACGIKVTDPGASTRDALLSEMDALVASLYDLTGDDLNTIFADFSVEAVSNERREAIRRNFVEISKEYK